jgi:hypothetical protein
VEARLSVPDTYGMSQDESAPSLPSGIQIGWLSPVTNTTGDVALPPVPPAPLTDTGAPGGASVAWNLHGYFCTYYASGCRFGDLGTLGCPPPS